VRRAIRRPAMKATTLLERQHRNLQQLCEAVERGSGKIRESLLPQLAGDLAAHIAVEEQVLYPAACEASREDELMQLSRSRHAQMMQSLESALETPVDGEEFTVAIGELRNVVEFHAEEQEESLFPQLEALLDTSMLRRLAQSMLDLYHVKVEAGYARTADLPHERNSARV
jgi:hemerythrin superfamily protein